MTYLGHNKEENEVLHKCPCGHVHGDGHICGFEYLTELDLMGDEEYRIHCEKERRKRDGDQT